MGMNVNLSRLARIAKKKSRLIIGLMSGTSMDGLDIALCKITGHGLKTVLELKHFATIPYSDETKSRMLEVFAKKQVDFVKLSNLNPWIGRLHGQMVTDCLKKWKVKNSSVDVIASHGQTVMHAPAFLHPEDPINSTFQIGDGDHIAQSTGIITISDFRQKHIAAGGEGAPLAVYGDFFLLSDKKENRILLNIGGIANFTFLPAGKRAAKVFVTDTGPGNTLVDQIIRNNFPGKYYDYDAELASKGKVNESLLEVLKSDSFFRLPLPRTIGPELFNIDYVRKAQKNSKTESLSVNDLLATLTRFTAETISESIKNTIGKQKFAIYVSGGGAHNPLLIKWLKEILGVAQLQNTSVLGIPGDAKEAILFAVLANETLVGKLVDFGKRAKIPSTHFGKISFPT
ncbi:anhydro-N-acetylmuramic acid kinase AnmK [soil metagenome]